MFSNHLKMNADITSLVVLDVMEGGGLRQRLPHYHALVGTSQHHLATLSIQSSLLGTLSVAMKLLFLTYCFLIVRHQRHGLV